MLILVLVLKDSLRTNFNERVPVVLLMGRKRRTQNMFFSRPRGTRSLFRAHSPGGHHILCFWAVRFDAGRWVGDDVVVGDGLEGCVTTHNRVVSQLINGL